MSKTTNTTKATKATKYDRAANAEKRLAIIADPKRDGNRDGRARRGLRDDSGTTVRGFGAIATFAATHAPRSVSAPAIVEEFLPYAETVDPEYVSSGLASKRVARFFYEAAKHASVGKTFRVRGFAGTVSLGKPDKAGNPTVVARPGK